MVAKYDRRTPANTLFKAVVLMAMMLLTLPAAQSSQHAERLPPAGCVKQVTLGSIALKDTLGSYLQYIGNYEIPIVAIQQLGDTTHYIISAFISTYSIRENPPASIIKIANREALLYDGKGSIAQTAPGCFQALLKKYTRLLHTDTINRRDGVPLNETKGYFYDPILKDIAVSKDGKIITKFTNRFPYITYE